MNLSELLEGIYDQEIDERYRSLVVSSICSDSRKIEKDSCFIALKGAQFDGSQFNSFEKGSHTPANTWDSGNLEIK